MKLHKKIFLLFTLLSTFGAQSQNRKIDSVIAVYKNTALQDTVRFNALHVVSWRLSSVNPDTALYFSNLEYKFAEEIKKSSDKKTQRHGEMGILVALNDIGTCYMAMDDYDKSEEYFTKLHDQSIVYKSEWYTAYSIGNLSVVQLRRGDYKKAEEFSLQSLALKTKLKDKRGINNSLMTLGGIKFYQGNFTGAIDYYLRSLKIREELKELNGMASVYGNIGIIYENTGDYNRALEYQRKALALNIKTNDKASIGLNLGNMGNIYFLKTNYDSALVLYKQSLEIQTEINSKYGISLALSGLGNIYEQKKEYDKSIECHLKVIELSKETDDINGLALSYSHLAGVYLKKNDLGKAEDYARKGNKLSVEIGDKDEERATLEILYRVLRARGKLGEALESYEKFIFLKDSLYSDKNSKDLARKEIQYEYDKKSLADSIVNVEERKTKDLQLSEQKAQLKQERTQRFALYGGLLLMLVLGVIVYRSYALQKKAHHIISLQKKEVERQKHEVEHQKELVEEKQKEILDSINYAKRIQKALLASDELLSDNMKNFFVLFKPKDIVSGDFYWATEHQNKFYLAVCDSTGHGVPGAFMSLLNIGFLSEGIKEKDISETNEILNYVRNRLISTISKEGQQDGFDGILLCVDKKTGAYSYSAAHNSPTLISEGKLSNLNADKMPVGKGEKMDSFSKHVVSLKQGDTLYLYTDGYADQFGGPKGKKFKYKQLEDVLLSVTDLPLNEQSAILNQKFEEWKGDLEQVDDVLIIGIKN